MNGLSFPPIGGDVYVVQYHDGHARSRTLSRIVPPYSSDDVMIEHVSVYGRVSHYRCAPAALHRLRGEWTVSADDLQEIGR